MEEMTIIAPILPHHGEWVAFRNTAGRQGRTDRVRGRKNDTTPSEEYLIRQHICRKELEKTVQAMDKLTTFMTEGRSCPPPKARISVLIVG